MAASEVLQRRCVGCHVGWNSIPAYIVRRGVQPYPLGRRGRKPAGRWDAAAYDLRPVDHVSLGTGEPLALLHFQGGHARSWEPLFGALAARHEIWALAFPGFGSTPLLSEPPSMRALARAVAGFMAAQGHETFHVAGCSLGGGVALELARQGIARTATALSPAGFAEGADAAFLQASLASYPPSVRPLLGLAPRLAGSGAARRALVAQMATHGERWTADYLVALLRSVATAPGYEPTRRAALRERFRAGHQLTCPVTVAWAERDRLLLTARHAPRARRDLPQARHVLLPGCGHLPFFDDPGAVADAVLSTTARG